MRTLQLRFEQVVERRDPPVGTVCLGYDECVLWCGKREFLGSPLEGPLPPECDVRRPDPQCPVHVDSGRLLRVTEQLGGQPKGGNSLKSLRKSGLGAMHMVR
jgi:hypothetical protein